LNQYRFVEVSDSTSMIVYEYPVYNVYIVADFGKIISLVTLNKNNKCGKCGVSTPTHVHHYKLDPSHPDQNTVEVCEKCHTELHKRQ